MFFKDEPQYIKNARKGMATSRIEDRKVKYGSQGGVTVKQPAKFSDDVVTKEQK